MLFAFLQDGKTPYILAAENGRVDALNILEQGGADINIADKVALHFFACRTSHIFCVCQNIEHTERMSNTTAGNI